VALAAGLAVAPSAFAKGKPQAQGAAGPACSVNPFSVRVGSTYTVSATGLAPYAVVNIMVSDSVGTTAFSVQADQNGVTSATGRAYWTDTDTVRVQSFNGHQTTVYATCAFTVS
jgi:hypothetical protein